MNDDAPNMAKGPLRWALLLVGFVSLALAGLGVVLPILPTTPFVLLSAVCFSRSSTRFHSWLLRNRLFGPLIENWERDQSVTMRSKLTAIASIVVVGGASIVWVVDPVWAKVVMAATLATVAVWLWTRPTAPAAPSERSA